jgi:alkyl hydroperoxide reductase subunit AhpC
MREVPYLKEAYTRFHGNGFEIYSMSIDKEDDKDKWMQTIKEKGMEWTNVLRTDAKNTTEAYGVQGIPANFLIDCSTGEIVATNLRGNALTKKLEELSGKE